MNENDFLESDDLDSLLPEGESFISLNEMEQEMRNLLTCFTFDSKDLANSSIREQFEHYFGKYSRFLYSTITPYLLELETTEKRDNILQRINSFYESSEAQSMSSELKNKVIKLFDHVNLVINQNSSFYISQTTIREISQKEAQKAKNEISKSVDNLHSQLISIVSIFVAIAFVMFGGLSLMNNLFNYSALKRIPLFEMLCAGSLIGIVMILSIYAFIVFILRITGKLDYTLEEKEEIKKISDYINELHSDDKENKKLKKELVKYLKDKKYIKLPYRRLIVILCIILLLIMGISGFVCIWQSEACPQQQIEESETEQKTVVQSDQDNNSNQEGESTGNNQSIETNKK